MEVSGIGQGPESYTPSGVATSAKELLELQAQLVVKLIESARVPGPQDQTETSGLGIRVDVHI